MLRSLLAGFRGADGRSLARALALLLVVAGYFGAFHSGSMAAGSANDIVVCRGNDGLPFYPGKPPLPTAMDHCVCCAMGCGGAEPSVGGNGSTGCAADASTDLADGRGSIFLAVALFRPAAAGPRGPPALA